MILCILSSSSLQLYCRELATLHSSWVDTLWLQCFHPPDILHAPHAPPHAPPHTPHAPPCTPLGQLQRVCHPQLLAHLRYSPHSLCSCTVESLPPSDGSILCLHSSLALLPWFSLWLYCREPFSHHH